MMTHLTTEQLQELTDKINARLAEFGTLLSMPKLAPGVVRIANDVITEWQGSQPLSPAPQEAEYDILQDAYHAGFAPQVAPGKQVNAPVDDRPRLVTNSEPAPAPTGPPAPGDKQRASTSANGPAAASTGHRAPAADVAREKLAHALANGSAGALSMQTAAALGPEHTVVTPLKNPRAHLPTLDELVKELKRQAMGGTMPTMAQFDDSKPATWATAQAHTKRFEMTWGDLAARAGLKPKRAETA